ncbi:alpha/beta hydrolase [Priestia sp. Y58]|uniref:alpha/beta fold hydrolase n=1 Tax=Priestia TaxID=2800373 RepID=UPI002220478D|nr:MULTISPECIES: alpha/beta hydrolase [Priestia]MDG0032547.1 alpha/beta hydrolase [Priestia sp. Y58]UYV51507.1 alpha/beta hydrolase [Priestia megaterium]
MKPIKAKKHYLNGLYFEVKGTGEPIIFIHGIGSSHSMFKPQVDFFSLTNQTITVDLKGNGKSESVPTSKYLTVHFESLLEVYNFLEIEKAVVVGVSYGGIVAQNFTIEHSDKVKRLVLIDTYAQLFPRSLPEVRLAIFGALILFASWLPSKLVLPFFSRWKKWDLAHKQLEEVFRNWRAKDVSRQLIEVFGMDLLEKVGNLNIPVLAIVGDAMDTVVQKAKEIEAHIPNCNLRIIKNSADPTNLCQPDEVNNEIFTFITEDREDKLIQQIFKEKDMQGPATEVIQ